MTDTHVGERPVRGFWRRADFGEALLYLGTLFLLVAWHTVVSAFAPTTWVEVGDGSIEVPSAPRVIANLVIPAVVFSGAGFLLVGRSSRERRLAAIATIAGGVYAAMAVAQVIPGFVGVGAATVGALALAGVAIRRSRVATGAAVRAVLVALAPVPLAVVLVILGAVGIQAVGGALLGDIYQSRGHHEFTASVPYTLLKVVGWFALAFGTAVVAGRVRRRRMASTLRVVAGVVAAIGAGEALLGSVRTLFFERSPLEPWLGIALVLAVAAVLVAVAARTWTSGYLVGAGVATWNALYALNLSYVATGGSSTPVPWAIEGALLLGLGVVLWRRQVGPSAASPRETTTTPSVGRLP